MAWWIHVSRSLDWIVPVLLATAFLLAWYALVRQIFGWMRNPHLSRKGPYGVVVSAERARRLDAAFRAGRTVAHEVPGTVVRGDEPWLANGRATSFASPAAKGFQRGARS
jgi:hypothetical protein